MTTRTLFCTHPMFPWLRRSVLRGAPAVLLMGALAGAARAAPPDLVSMAVVGPQQIHVSSESLVSFTVANFGDPLAGTYTVQIVLSADDVVDGSDLILASVESNLLGMQSALVAVPFAIPTGTYRWGMNILPAPGEVTTWNNSVTGTEAYVVKSDLHLPDADPIQLFWNPTDDAPPVAEVAVENAGSAGSILVYTVAPLNPTPWLEIEPGAGFAIANQVSEPVRLVAKPEGLAIGPHTTTLRFQNYPELNDYVDLDVTLTVGPAVFTPGDRLVGQIAAPGDEDVLHVDLLAGEKVRMWLKSQAGDLKTTITFIDPDGIIEGSVTWPHSAEVVKKVQKVNKSGTYTLRITGKGATHGSYQIRTGSKLPKKARPRTLKVKGGALDTAMVEVLGRKGATLDFGVDPGDSMGPMTLGVITPSGGIFDLNNNTKLGPGDTILVEDLPMTELGSFWIELTGFASPSAKAKLSVFPVQPKKPKNKIYVP